MLAINGTKKNKLDIPDHAAALQHYVDDDTVRDFTDWDEALEYHADTTDHIGNLPGPIAPGTWLRFHRAGLNIVGEHHDHVTLDQVLGAVGSGSFIYERFATEPLPDGSRFRAAYLAENNTKLNAFRVDPASDLTLIGGESLHPKIADTMAELIPFFNRSKNMIHMASGGNRYIGQPDQRYLKLGWAWAKDLVGHAVTPAETALVTSVNTHNAVLDPFITALLVDGYIGDPLRQHQHQNKYAPLLDLCTKYVPVMVERALNDPDITPDERHELAGMPVTTPDEQQEMFALWRNFYFAGAVARAVARHVRYAGMGSAHSKWLIQNDRVPNTAHVHKVTPKSLAPAIAHTNALRHS